MVDGVGHEGSKRSAEEASSKVAISVIILGVVVAVGDGGYGGVDDEKRGGGVGVLGDGRGHFGRQECHTRTVRGVVQACWHLGHRMHMGRW